jgi:hypothetical protein
VTTAELAESETWPRDLVEVEPNPSDVAPRWAEHIQGIAHAPGVWFVTQADGVWRFPMDADLASLDATHPSVVHHPIPEAGIDHFGDCDYHEGFLYVAVEGSGTGSVSVFDRDLRYFGTVPLDQGEDAPWCAINPRDGLLYSSRFATDRLAVYERQGSPQSGAMTLEQVSEVPLLSEDGALLRLERVQGGVFSPSGQLYLTDDTPAGGILGFDPHTGRRALHVAIPYRPGAPEYEVVEGLTLLDLSGARVPAMRGQLHVLVFNASEDRPDAVWLRHFEAVR